MRLTDTCTIRQNGTLYGPEARPCEFGHRSGELTTTDGGRIQLSMETARAIVGPDPELVDLSPSGLTLTHKGISYSVTAILPRYRPGGRLHHLSIDIRRAEAVAG